MWNRAILDNGINIVGACFKKIIICDSKMIVSPAAVASYLFCNVCMVGTELKFFIDIVSTDGKQSDPISTPQDSSEISYLPGDM